MFRFRGWYPHIPTPSGSRTRRTVLQHNPPTGLSPFVAELSISLRLMHWIELVHHIRPKVTFWEFGLILLGFHSPLLTQSQLLSLPPATKMLQFTGLQLISEQRTISGSKVACTYPEHIAACHGPKPEPGHPLYG